MVQVIDKENFKKEVLDEQKKTVLVDFSADWCGPCKMMEPILNQFSQDNPEVKIVKVDVDQAQALAMEYGVMSIPTMYVFKKGKPTQQMMGVQDQKSLEAVTK